MIGIQITEILTKVKKILADNNNIFITGGGGVGKSYLLDELKQYYKDKLVLTSTTGISALNIGGQTLHSWCGIGIVDKPVARIIHQIRQSAVLYKQLFNCKILAIDEISMLDDYTFEYVDKVLRNIKNSKLPFGGIQLILVGDFFQLPPVKCKQTGRKFCFQSPVWKKLKLITILLNKVHRQTDKKFINILNNIRVDNISEADINILYHHDYSLIYEIDKNILQLFGTNNDADIYNKKCFSEINSETYKYNASDSYFLHSNKRDNDQQLTEEEVYLFSSDRKILENFDKDCKFPKLLELKKGCRVMLLKNISITDGLVNGSCGTIKSLSNSSVEVLFDNGKLQNITPEYFEYNQNNKLIIKRKQYPLKLAYGITIHKSQGMTFEKLVVNFNTIFDFGQAYVALSRVKSLDGLIIKDFNPNKIVANLDVKIFYSDLLKNNKKVIVC